MTVTGVFLGRQPILDERRRTHGYELLYRDGDVAEAFFADPDDATRNVVELALLEWGLDHLVGDAIAFVNVTAEFLRAGMYSALPASRVVLELLETTEFNGATADAMRTAAYHGYRFALDDLITMSTPGLQTILPLVDIVKVDVLSLDPAQTRDLVVELRATAPKVVLLAEKVETIETFEFCRDAGFDLFQGYFFAKPELLHRGARPTSRRASLLLMAAVQEPDITIDGLADLANADPTLAYRLLKLVNSSASGLIHTIKSVRHAIVLLGIEHVRHLATLLALAATAGTNTELITLAVTRAQLAGHLLADTDEANSAYTAGLLSVIDAIFHCPMSELVDDLPLSDEVRRALLFGSGQIGQVLRTIRAYENCDVRELHRCRPHELDEIREAFGQSTRRAAILSRDALTLTTASGHG